MQLLKKLASEAHEFLEDPHGVWLVKKLLELEAHVGESVHALELMVCCMAESFEDNLADIQVRLEQHNVTRSIMQADVVDSRSESIQALETWLSAVWA